jgi:hypothetical protein
MTKLIGQIKLNLSRGSTVPPQLKMISQESIFHLYLNQPYLEHIETSRVRPTDADTPTQMHISQHQECLKFKCDILKSNF